MPYKGSLLIREHEIEEIMRRFKGYRKRHNIMEACRRVEADMGIPAKTIYEVQMRMRPTTEIATQYLKSQSLKLAMRVVRKANVDQAIGILSRPNIGVLDPQGEGAVGGGRQFMIGVAMDSLGSVKVGVQIGETPGYKAPQNVEGVELEELEEESVVNYTEDEVEEEPAPKRVWHQRDPPKPKEIAAPLPEGATAQGHVGTSLNYRLAVAKAERKLQARANRKEKEAVRGRAKELAAELQKVREGLPK